MQEINKNERIQYLDVLRGFALCGILFVNMPSFLGDRPNARMGNVDQAIRLVFDLFIQTKFYTLFSVLFGAGFYLFIQRLHFCATAWDSPCHWTSTLMHLAG